MLRLLAAANVIEEVGEDNYKATPFSASLGEHCGADIQTG
jgi:hypothetical protein